MSSKSGTLVETYSCTENPGKETENILKLTSQVLVTSLVLVTASPRAALKLHPKSGTTVKSGTVLDVYDRAIPTKCIKTVAFHVK